jgi:hypothetical protein
VNTNEYKRNITKTLPVRSTKAALRHLARNNARSNTLYALINLKTATGKFLADMQPYLLGQAVDEAMKKQAFDSIGDVGQFLVAAAKVVGAKLPSSTKKSRLKDMTRGKAILTLDTYATELLAMENRVFNESLELPLPDVLKLAPEEQEAILKNARKANMEIIAKREEHIHQEMADILQKMIPLYWSLVYDMFSVSPSEVFKANMEKVAENYPEGFFQEAKKETVH